MVVRPRIDPVFRSRIGASRLGARALGFAALWAVLSGGDGWIIGIPIIILAATMSCLSSPVNRWSLPGLARFVPYFLWNSLRGGFDVAVRALHPRLPIEPAVVNYELRLKNATANVLLADTVTLLPGTLSADLRGDVLLVHVLNASGPFLNTLQAVERRVADVFGIDIDAETG